MNIKQKIVTLGLLLVAAAAFVPTLPAAAACDTKNGNICCGDTATSIIGGSTCSGINDKSANSQDSGVWKILIFILQIMTAGVGILAVGGIVFGAVLYTTAGDKPEQTKKAIGIITNVVIGIVAYGLMYLVLNFLIPGGIFT